MKVDGYLSILYVIFNNFCDFYKKFCDFFCGRHSLINRPCYNNFWNNFWNLNRVTFTQWKHLESRVIKWVKVIKRCTFHKLKKLILIPGNQSSIEKLQLFDRWHCQSIVTPFSFLLRNSFRWCLSGIAAKLSSIGETLTGFSSMISPYLAKFVNHNKSIPSFLHEIVIIFLYFIFSSFHGPVMCLVHSTSGHSYKS